MVSHTLERILSVIDGVIECYNQLRKYETEGCKFEELRKTLIDIRDTAEELPPLTALIIKENPSQIGAIKEFANLFKVPFLTTLKVHILSLSNMQKDVGSDLLKMQANLAVTYMNIDGYIDGLRMISSFLR